MDKECDMAFRDLKCYLARAPTLSQLEPEEDLYMYLVVFDHAMSVLLLKHQEGIQRPVYYLSKMLVDVETQYVPLGNMALALVHATRKLPHYFQAHTVANRVSPVITLEEIGF